MTEEVEMSRYLVVPLDGDPDMPVLFVCPNNTDMGPYVLSCAGEGNPVMAFESLPSAILLADEIGADFNFGFLASTDYQSNRNAVTAMYGSPPLAQADPDTGVAVWKIA